MGKKQEDDEHEEKLRDIRDILARAGAAERALRAKGVQEEPLRGPDVHSVKKELSVSIDLDPYADVAAVDSADGSKAVVEEEPDALDAFMADLAKVHKDDEEDARVAEHGNTEELPPGHFFMLLEHGGDTELTRSSSLDASDPLQDDDNQHDAFAAAHAATLQVRVAEARCQEALAYESEDFRMAQAAVRSVRAVTMALRVLREIGSLGAAVETLKAEKSRAIQEEDFVDADCFQAALAVAISL